MKKLSTHSLLALLLLVVSLAPANARYVSKTISASKFFRSPYHMFLFKTAATRDTKVRLYVGTDTVAPDATHLDLRIGMYRQHRYHQYYEDSFDTCSAMLNNADGITILVLDLQRSDKQFFEIDLERQGVVWDDNTENVFFVLFDCQEEIKRKSHYEWKIKLEFDVPQKSGYLNQAEVVTYYFKIIMLLIVAGVLGMKYKAIKREFYSEYCDTNYAFMIVVFGVLF